MKPAATALAAIFLLAVASAQTPVFRTSATEVTVDLVVTGPQGRIIKNLKPNEIALFDNGRRRTLSSFRLVSRSVHLPAATLRRLEIPPRLRPQPFNLIIFVFGNVTSLGRSLARRSALWFIHHEMGPADYAAVFTAGAGLRALTPLTKDRAVLQRAVLMASGGASAPRQDVLTAEQQLDQYLGGPAQAMPAAERANMKRAGGSGNPGAAALASALRLIIQHASSAANAASSWSSLDALRALARALGILPGRKEVIYYSQWLDVNPTTIFMFRAVMHDANRNHVSFYPVDPAGLGVTSSASQSAAALEQAAGVSGTPPPFTATPGEAVENVTYAGRLTALQELAGATGGFLSARTNDLQPFLARIAADITSHYELTYNPGPLTGGAFHRITIKIPGHPKWRVRARKGYYVLPRLPQPLPGGMTPLLLALATRPAPRALALTASAFAFPVSIREADVSLLAQVPLGGLAAAPPSAEAMKHNPQLRGRELVRFALLQTVQDAAGRTLGDAGQRFRYAVSKADISAAWAPAWHYQLSLPPGAYTANAVLYQMPGPKATVLSRPFIVPAAGQVRLSTIALVQALQPPRAPAASAAGAAADPWLYQHYEVVPSLTGALAASSDPRRIVGFYFIAHVPPGTTGATVRMRFARGGSVFLRTPPFPLPAPDAHGQIRFLANIPLNRFPPGSYSAAVAVQAAAGAASSSVQFQTVR